jgi:hypothetical protein
MRKDVFISYRREGGEHLALRVSNALKERRLSVFMDRMIPKGREFNETLLEEIKKAANIVVIVTHGCFNRCNDDDDWLRREIRYALEHNKNIVPLIDSGVRMPGDLPDDISRFANHNGVTLTPGHFDEIIGGLVSECLARRSDIGRHLPSLVWESSDRRWDDSRAYIDEWQANSSVAAVTMVHISGWVFRRQRLIYQGLKGRRLPPSWLGADEQLQLYGVGKKVSNEERRGWTRRITKELEGREPWRRGLRKLRVLIGDSSCFEDWRRANPRKPIEKYDATRYFWTEYLTKLTSDLNKGRRRLFEAELYETASPPFYAHVFEYGNDGHPVSGGRIVRLPRRREQNGLHDEPVALTLRWPAYTKKPNEFDSLQKSVEEMLATAGRIRL